MVRGGNPFYRKFWSTRPRWNEIADFQPIFARSASAVTPSEKSSINTNREVIFTRFPLSLKWSSYAALKSPKGISKTQNGRFPSKIALRLKKTKFLCVKTVSCKVVRHSWPKYPWQKWLVGRPLVPELWFKLTSNWPRWREIAYFQSIFARSASAVASSEKVQLTLIGSWQRAFQWA